MAGDLSQGMPWKVLVNDAAQNFGSGETGQIRKGVWHCFLMLTLLNFGMEVLILAGQSYAVSLVVADPTAEIMASSQADRKRGLKNAESDIGGCKLK